MTSVLNSCLVKSSLIQTIRPTPTFVFRRNCTTKQIRPPHKFYKQFKNLNETPWKEKSLQQLFEEANYKDPTIFYKVNIGLPHFVINKSGISKERLAQLKQLKSDKDLEKKAREHKLFVPLNEVSKEWEKERASDQIRDAAEFYGVFQDLFGDAFFYPKVNLDISFKHNEFLVPVFRGNTLKPNQVLTAPEVVYDADPDSLWTLVVCNLDGHTEDNAEYLHYFVGNIPGNDLRKANIVAEYVQPFPARGTGFHRLVFVLYKQEKKMDYSSISVPSNKFDFESRQFHTYDFYRSRQEDLTPAGLAFCQVDWDQSVSRFYHTVLEVEEPIYEYDFAPPYHPEQVYFPIRQPFNLYMDRYRDPKQIAKEYLLKKLKNRHPFEKPKPPLKYPNSVPVRHDLDERLYGRVPSWLKLEKLKQRMGHGRINDY